ncbi:MAG: mitofilin family membrane protein [Azospirillaceae bacterium]|nr:mitofilin family membrane protein [Azospirillaceae bacterium]
MTSTQGDLPEPAEDGGHGAAERIIERFGGIRPMATKLGVPVTTVQGWKKRGAIPANRHGELLRAANRHHITLTQQELDAALPVEDKLAPEVGAPAAVSDDAAPSSSLSVTADPVAVPVLPASPFVSPPAGSPPAGADAVSADDAPPETPLTETPLTDSLPPETMPADPHAIPPAAAERAPSPPPPPVAPASEAGASAPRPVAAGGASQAPAVAAIVIALIAAAGAATSPLWTPRVFGEPTAPFQAQVVALQRQIATLPAPVDLTPLTRQLAGLEDRLAKIERQAAALTATGAAGGDAVVDLKPLSDRVAQLEQRPDAAALFDHRVVPLEQKTNLLSQLPARVDGLEGRLQSVDQRLAAIDQAFEGLKPVTAKVGQIDGDMVHVERDVAASSQRIADLTRAVNQQTTADNRTRALVLAAGQLGHALEGSAPFRNELSTVQAIAGGDPRIGPMLDQVAPYADQGIPTLPLLADAFEALAPEIIQAKAATFEKNWLDQARARLDSLVSIRRQGATLQPDSVEAAISQAEAHLKQGDLDHTVQDLAVLTGGPADRVTPWLKLARARLAAQQALVHLSSQAIERLAATTEGTVTP